MQIDTQNAQSNMLINEINMFKKHYATEVIKY